MREFVRRASTVCNFPHCNLAMKQNSLSFLMPDHCNMMYMLTHRLHSFWMIPIGIRDPRSLRWWHIKGTVCCTDESLPRVDSLVPFKHHDLCDLRSLTQIHTTPKECTHDISYASLSNKYFLVSSSEMLATQAAGPQPGTTLACFNIDMFAKLAGVFDVHFLG